MNLAEFEKKLLDAARSVSVSDTVPYAFEKRIMAHISAQTGPDAWSWWARALWRASAPCLAIMMVFSAWSFYGSRASGSDLSQDLESAVFAIVDQEQPDSTW